MNKNNSDSNASNIKRIEVKVIGIVQGVSFRAYTKNHALRLGLKGYARNLNDGSVEIVAEGEENKLYQLLKFIKKGPPLAKVYDTQVKWLQPTNEFKTFKIKYWF